MTVLDRQSISVYSQPARSTQPSIPPKLANQVLVTLRIFEMVSH